MLVKQSLIREHALSDATTRKDSEGIDEEILDSSNLVSETEEMDSEKGGQTED